MWKLSILLMPSWFILLLAVLQLGLIATARIASLNAAQDLLAPHDTITPGRSMSALEQFRPCLSREFTPMSDVVAYCETRLKEQPFASVMATVSVPDSTIVQLAVRVDGLRFGDLVLLWGQPQVVETYGGSAVVRWHRGLNGTAARLAPFNSLSYWSPIISIVVG